MSSFFLLFNNSAWPCFALEIFLFARLRSFEISPETSFVRKVFRSSSLRCCFGPSLWAKIRPERIQFLRVAVDTPILFEASATLYFFGLRGWGSSILRNHHFLWLYSITYLTPLLTMGQLADGFLSNDIF